MTLGQLKAHLDSLIAQGISENTPLKIREGESPRFEDMTIEFDQIFVDEKGRLSGSGAEALTCFWIKQ